MKDMYFIFRAFKRIGVYVEIFSIDCPVLLGILQPKKLYLPDRRYF